MANKAECKACHEPIVWLKTFKGKNIPVDDNSSVREGDETFDRSRHSCHFDTCPNADQFRKTKRG